MNISPLAGKPPDASMLVNVPRLITAYYTERPDPSVPEQRVAFGTSGHRGSAFDNAFNEWHILAITQAICLYREQHGIDGPLFLGMDTHALSVPAFASALEVLAANGVDVMIAERDEYTPTPVISHAILTYNRGRKTGWPTASSSRRRTIRPHDGGFKYNPPNGGPADVDCHRLDRGEGERVSRGRPSGREEDSLRAGSSRLHDTPARLPRRLHRRSRQRRSTWTPFAARSSAWESIRSAAPASITGDASPSATA